jgi:hypothetical protein
VTSPCSSGTVQFVIYEIDNDLYTPGQIPPISAIITEASKDTSKAETFLTQTLGNPAVKSAFEKLKSTLFTAGHQDSDRDGLLTQIRDAIDQVASLAFAMPEIQRLAVGVKRSLNSLIFNAISARSHFTLMMAFNKAYAAENSAAQRASHTIHQSTSLKIDPAKMDLAVRELHGLLHRPNPAEIIEHLVLFFDAMVAALPGVEVAADDILPAICLAMTRDLGFGSHVVSLFNYLTEIWPSAGMDDRTTYILVTCSIAAQHLATVQAKPEPPKPAMVAAPRLSERTEETIELLEDLLNCI